MQRLVAVVVLAVTALVTAASPAAARSTPAGSSGRPLTIQTVFRLNVTGNVAPGTTFWLAYGPLAGHFGMIQLHQQSPGVYEASQRLPTSARTLFTYLAGRGAIRTRAGLAPGAPVVTIRRIGPASIWPKGVPAARWFSPAG